MCRFWRSIDPNHEDQARRAPAPTTGAGGEAVPRDWGFDGTPLADGDGPWSDTAAGCDAVESGGELASQSVLILDLK
jgi:hypothetical protein